MSALHDWELADTLEAEQARKRSRKPGRRPRPAPSPLAMLAVVPDPAPRLRRLDDDTRVLYERIRVACCDDESGLPAEDLEEHAGRIVLTVLEARKRAARRDAYQAERRLRIARNSTGGGSETLDALDAPAAS